MDPLLRDTLARALSPELFREVVAEPEATPTGDWVARSRAFALFEPVRSAAVFLRTSLARRKLDGGRALERYDFEGLLLEAIDRVVDHYGLGEPLTTEELTAHLASLVEQMERADSRQPDAAWCASVAEDALEILLNRRPRTEDIVEAPHCAYVHRHLVPGAAPRTSTFAFLLLEEARDGDRRIVRARQEAVLFTVRMLDFDLEEMGEVLEALLERQMKRGNFDGARRTAEQGRQVASGYAARIRAQLDEVRRRPLASGYARQLAPVLDGARAHLAERTTRERELRDTVERLRWEASPDVHSALDAIERELETCSRVYVSLARAIAEAPHEHETRRAHAFAGRVAPGTYPDPLDAVLVPALRLPAAHVERAGPELLRRLSPPVRPRLFDLASFVATAFRPEPADRSLEVEQPRPPVRRLPAPEIPLAAAEVLVTARIAASPEGCKLSQLLDLAQGDRALEVAIALVVHDWRRRGAEGDVPTVLAGERRRVRELVLDDLLVLPQAAPTPRRQEVSSHVAGR